ncbi:MAG: serine hydrolase domain-containing protein [Bacteroidia bacterium]|nr:serine hydrolase domain-containing protein [Bacteroidia bacterium]
MKRTLLLVLAPLFFLISCKTTPETVARYEIPASNPDEASMDAAMFAKMDSVSQALVDEGKLPGIEAMVIRGGKIVHNSRIGFEDLEKKQPLREGQIFRMASMTKPVTAVAAMILYQEGKFKLDDPVSKYIPEFANTQVLDSLNPEDYSRTTVPANRELTVRNLLTHSSGLGYGFVQPEAGIMYAQAGVNDAWSLEPFVLADKMKTLAGLPLLHQPGEKWTYGLGIDMTGYLVEVLSGMPLDQFMQERIFDPLGMDDTGFYLEDSYRDRMLPVISYSEEGGLGNAVKSDQIARQGVKALYPDFTEAQIDSAGELLMNFAVNGAKTYFSGGGGLCGTTENYARFALMLTNGGELNGVRILNDTTVQRMCANNTSHDFPYGLGVSISPTPEHATYPEKDGAFGWGGYFKTRYWSDPSEDLTVLLMTQSNPNPNVDPHFDTCTKMIYGAIRRAETGTK